MSDAENKNKPNRLGRPSWSEAKFFLIAAVILGGVMAGGVWTRIEEFEAGKVSSGAIVMTIVVGLILIALLAVIRSYLLRMMKDD